MTSSGGYSDEDRAAQLHNALAIEDLIAANNESNKTMVGLVERVREETAARDRKVEALEKSHRQARVVIILTVVLTLVLITIAVFNAINLAAAQRAQRQTRDIAAGVAANQAGQIQLLDTVKQYELTTLYCARTNPFAKDPKGEKFLACVYRLAPGGPVLPEGS